LKIHFDLPIIAHRGASALAPENTIAAFMKAKELGLTWVEFDVQLAASGEVVVIHDEDLHRTTNTKGKIIDLPYRFIKTLDAGSWFDPKYSQEKISTLAEALTFLEREKMAANVEIKSLPGYEALLTKYVMNSIAEFHIPLFISSFSRMVLENIRQLNKEITIGYLMDEWQPDWENFCDHVHAKLVDVNHQILTKERIQQIKSTDRFLLAYTVDSPIRAQELLALGVDAVFSNCHTGFVENFRR
jgi:glycerophosphoryl diester phosphodiesterase